MPTATRPPARRQPTHAEIQNFARAIAAEREVLSRARIVPPNTFGRLPAAATPLESLKSYAGTDATTAVDEPSANRDFVNAVVEAAQPRRIGNGGQAATNLRSAHETDDLSRPASATRLYDGLVFATSDPDGGPPIAADWIRKGTPPPPPPPNTFTMDMGDGATQYDAGASAASGEAMLPTLSAVDPPTTSEDDWLGPNPQVQRLATEERSALDAASSRAPSGLGSWHGMSKDTRAAETEDQKITRLITEDASPNGADYHNMGDNRNYFDYQGLSPRGQALVAKAYREKHAGDRPADPAPLLTGIGAILSGEPERGVKAYQDKGITGGGAPPVPGVAVAPTSTTAAQNQGSGILPGIAAFGSLPSLPARATAAAAASLTDFAKNSRDADFKRQRELQDDIANQLGISGGDYQYVDPETGELIGADPYNQADDPKGEMNLGGGGPNLVEMRQPDGSATFAAVPRAQHSNEYVVNPTTGEPEELGKYAITPEPVAPAEPSVTDPTTGITTFPGLRVTPGRTREDELQDEIDYRAGRLSSADRWGPMPETTGRFADGKYSPDDTSKLDAYKAKEAGLLSAAEQELASRGTVAADLADAQARVDAAKQRGTGQHTSATSQENYEQVLGVATALAKAAGIVEDPTSLLKPIGRGVWTISDTAFKHFTKKSDDPRVDMERARLFQSMAATIDKSLAGIASYSMKPEERLEMVAERDRLNVLAMSLAGGTGGGAPMSEDDAAVMEYLDTLDPEE